MVLLRFSDMNSSILHLEPCSEKVKKCEVFFIFICCKQERKAVVS
jgi:hypothetical protein